MFTLFFLVFSSLLAGCNPVAEYQAVYTGDMNPPRFARVEPVAENEVLLRFDEPVELVRESALLDGEPLESTAFLLESETARLRRPTPFVPGQEYQLQAVFVDEAGNSASVLTTFYGPNPRLPTMLINEFTPEGSSSHPDMIELLVLEAGNLGGAVLYEGSPSDWESRLVLPPVDVDAGEYVILHWKPEGVPEEVNEVTAKDESGGLDAHPEAYDFWLPGGDGFSNTNGSLVLSAYTGGPMMDAVIFSTKRFDPNEEDRGFGRSAVLLRNEEIVGAGEWEIEGDYLIPEDGIDPEESSATRSINRTPGAEDTNSPADWHVVPSSGATFGYENSIERY